MSSMFGKKPKYETYLESSRTLAEVIKTEEEDLARGLPKPKKVKVKQKPFVLCQECEKFTGKDGKWACEVGILRCIHG